MWAEHIRAELRESERLTAEGDLASAFARLERAHVLGQSSTYYHTLVHIRMLKLGFRSRSLREVAGQIFRIVGAATKTPLGMYPKGNTGGANVWFFRSMPIPPDLQELIDRSAQSKL